MRGIAGIVNFGGLHADAPLRVQAMCAAQAHRGPDDQGGLDDGVACLGHRRLSIIDLATGHQPMATPDGQETIRRRNPEQMRAAARQRPVETFAWEVTFRRTFELYDRLLVPRRRATGHDEAALPGRLHP